MNAATSLVSRGQDLLARDSGLLWHPYASLDDGARYAVTAAQGVRLTLQDAAGGTHEVIDGMGSWWSMVHGYRNQVLDAAAHAQIDSFSHVMFGGLTHAPAVELAERLVAMAPGDLSHVFLADSGSISVEVALKLVLQYQHARGHTGRQRFAALRGGYHGDTFAAMGVCDPVDGMHAAFARPGAEQLFLPRPPAARLTEAGYWEFDAAAFAAWETDARALAAAHAAELAGIIAEPVLQGAGGMYVYAPAALRVLRSIADEHGLLLVLDEIATGFGRTGKLFASEWAGVLPDVMCVGKALTGGYMTLAAMLCTPKVAAALAGAPGGGSALLHGPTFMGNPLACAVANASLGLLTGPGDPRAADAPWRGQVASLETGLREALAPAAVLPSVKDVRVLGGVGVIQLHEQVRVAEVTAAAVRHGAWVRPFRDLLYVMPPYISSKDEIRELGAALVVAVEHVHGA
ncbi:adenosylmethionine--8-amino-7-oxononanoate transaminase [Paeniglutamicibacter psychrophenolicus]|uniref:Adenosylmethionine-8-amino-7-oxononanoate aminotransferase n=1 Tax=Paeniglutamicibacter psychrophenolicus TaxID=257454 RepID=A0ABS4WB00_9MICC|nr:adenosylmethionine--8-amino-7-oxononanoate transaminase [Paeniglutamicibacter psychrophenolicus]MBP2373379.1 adenosylmethionine-8-amino-7-oxononanoate aminotransferase [Paeniglutamicibacter psychrophenolicus]